MGYNIHITRNEDWIEEDPSKNISLQEWINYIKSDPEMRLDQFAEAKTTTGQTIRVDDETMCVWAKYSGNGVKGNFAWLWLSNGNIVAKNPDEEIRNKMVDIVNALDARVQGDDGEYYTKPTAYRKSFGERPWWKRLFD